MTQRQPQGPEALLEGMADYFVLQAQHQQPSRENSFTNFSPQKKNGWQMISKAIFNQQAPQHRIFKENLKKINNDGQMSHRVDKSDQYTISDKYHTHQHHDNKENMLNNFINRNHGNQKIVDYFQKVQERLQTLNQMKSQLGSYKIDNQWHKTIVKKEKLKPDIEEQQKPKNILIDSSSDSSDKEDKNQIYLAKQEKIKSLVQRFYSHTTRSFEAKRLSNPGFFPPKQASKPNSNMLKKRRVSTGLNPKLNKGSNSLRLIITSEENRIAHNHTTNVVDSQLRLHPPLSTILERPQTSHFIRRGVSIHNKLLRQKTESSQSEVIRKTQSLRRANVLAASSDFP